GHVAGGHRRRVRALDPGDRMTLRALHVVRLVVAHRLGAVLRRRAAHRPGHRGEQRGTQRPARGFGRRGIATSEAHGGSGGGVYRGRSGPAGRPTSRAGITWSVRTSRRASPPTCSTVHRVVV